MAADRFMPVLHCRQPGFTYTACGPFIKNKTRIQNFKETGDTRYLYQNKLDKSYFQKEIAYGDYNYLPRRTASENSFWVSHDKGFTIVSNLRYDRY